VIEAVRDQIEKGTHFGACHEFEILLAEQVRRMVPNARMTRFTNSGTEANMYAVRLARAFTGKRRIAKFEGGWHGGYDALQVGVKYPFDLPESAGLTNGATRDTVLLPYNDLEKTKKKLRKQDVACILIEPVLGAGGGVPAETQFLKGLREYCDEQGTLLIFDEVITGFRLAPGGAQQYFGVQADMIVLGKILGGGFPIGAFSGRDEIMERLDSVAIPRPNYSFHGGTFAANPVTMVAGLATLKQLADGALINKLNMTCTKIREELSSVFDSHRIKAKVVGAGSIFNTHFTDKAVTNASNVYTSDRRKLVDYNLTLIAKGLFVLPTHNSVICTKHSSADIEKLYTATENYSKSKSR
jgi:glutamate-1-semialdehyde 2,1-aminomutase